VFAGICLVGAGFFVIHKAKRAGIDPELMRTNPGLAIGKMMAAFNPDVEVVRTNDATGTITVRDRRTGKEVTMSFDQAKSGKFTFSAEDDRGKTATVEIGGSSAKLPSWIPEYPGATAQTNLAARGESSDGSGQGGNFTFTTKDSTGKVMSFYQEKARELGMTVRLNAAGGDGATLIAGDEDGRRTLTILIGSNSGDTTVNVTYASKN